MVDNSQSSQQYQDRWAALERPTPEWFKKAKLGFFIHWGPYSVPAWAEPIGELGTIEPIEWFKHNPYAEWYYNTIRIPNSPAQIHHQEQYDGRDYDLFLDDWKAESFDPDSLVKELMDAGGSYLVLTTKHHDGVCLWDAPESEGRNTVKRGPKKDLVGAYAKACQDNGMRFGAYYSGGLDWHVRPFPPIGLRDSWDIKERPLDSEYSLYCVNHLYDLIEKYSPDILWNDIDWPDEGKNFEVHGIGRVFETYYAKKPDGVVNDRWNVPHADFTTSEYQHLLDSEENDIWENCRGVGLSFGYNAVEGRSHALSGSEIVKQLIDMVLRGGRMLLGVGPMADGRLPKWQSEVLADLGEWMKPFGLLLEEVQPIPSDSRGGLNIEAPWVRFGSTDEGIVAFIDSNQPVRVPDCVLLTPDWASLDSNVITFDRNRPGPVIIRLY